MIDVHSEASFNPLAPVFTLFSLRNNMLSVIHSSTVRCQRVKIAIHDTFPMTTTVHFYYFDSHPWTGGSVLIIHVRKVDFTCMLYLCNHLLL